MRWLIVTSMLGFAFACEGSDDRIAYVQLADVPVGYAVGPSDICLPLGRVLLVRRQERLYGLRVVKALSNRERNAFKVIFDVSSLEARGWQTRAENVEERPLRGFGHPFMFQTGETRLRVGTFALSFHGPSCVTMYEYGSEEKDQRLSFAPTAWQAFSDVDVRAAGLRWYRVDLSRSVDVPLADLPRSGPMQP